MRVLCEDELDLIAGGLYIPGYGYVIEAPQPYNPYNPPSPYNPYTSNGGLTTNFPGGYPMLGPNSDYVNGMFDNYKIDVKMDITRDLSPAEKAAFVALNEAIATMTQIVRTPGFQTATASDGLGHIINGREVADKWALTDFVVTDKLYDNGGVGKTHATNDNNNVLLEINIKGLVNYMGNPTADGSQLFPRPEDAIAYIAHEMAHATRMGIANNAAIYSADSAGGASRTTEEFMGNEGLAWSGGEAILAMAGRTMDFVPEQPKTATFTVTK